MSLVERLRPRKPRIGCVLLSLVTVPCLSGLVGMFAQTLPPPAPIDREAVMPSYTAELEAARARGFTLDREEEAEHADVTTPNRLRVPLDAAECVAVVAATWGSQHPGQLRLSGAVGGRRRVVVEDSPEHRVAHAQWCTLDRPDTIDVELRRANDDVYAREGHVAGASRLAVLRAPRAAVGGLRALTRGQIPEETGPLLEGEIMAIADRERPAGARLAELDVPSMAARLLPQSEATYRVLHTGARNGAARSVRPRVAALPATLPAAWRPMDDVEALRHRVAPREEAGDPHPAVLALRNEGDGFVRVLAVIDAASLGGGCLELQLVRMHYGYDAVVSRVPPRSTSVPSRPPRVRAVPATDHVAHDRLCPADGVQSYVVPPTDRARYRLRIFSAS